jgi:hypothetical protein
MVLFFLLGGQIAQIDMLLAGVWAWSGVEGD